jgi:hypothetical protein
MIVIPEKVAYIKVPKAASTTIARLFWDRHNVAERDILPAEVATSIPFLPLAQVGQQLPLLNANWFYTRALGSYGWHASYQDMVHVFREQLDDFHWVASVRHPAARLFSVFSFQVVQGRMDAELTKSDFERFCRWFFAGAPRMSQQQNVHTWSQSRWLPPKGVECSIIRQESLAADVAKHAGRVESFRGVTLGDSNRSFSGSWHDFVSPALRTQIEDHYSEDMGRLGY